MRLATLACAVMVGGCVHGTEYVPCPSVIVYMSLQDSALVTDSTVVPSCR